MTKGNSESNDDFAFIKNMANALKNTPNNFGSGKDSNFSGSEMGHIIPERCGFGQIVKLSLPVTLRIQAGLRAVAGSLAYQAVTKEEPLLSDAARALIHVSEELDTSIHTDDDSVLITHEAALDLTTGLLDLADILFNKSFVLEALALEGVESHVLEVMVTPWSRDQKD
ncbi:MAG: hypothetical protein M1374_06955 [Firmicutes bacterium]|jgi:hypothetical protein|nr:hypothetical protein [Bacillota bacterium]